MANETYDHSHIICPACGHVDKDTWEVFHDLEETIDDYECGGCGASLTVTKSVLFTYEAKTNNTRIRRRGRVMENKRQFIEFGGYPVEITTNDKLPRNVVALYTSTNYTVLNMDTGEIAHGKLDHAERPARALAAEEMPEAASGEAIMEATKNLRKQLGEPICNVCEATCSPDCMNYPKQPGDGDRGNVVKSVTGQAARDWDLLLLIAERAAKSLPGCSRARTLRQIAAIRARVEGRES